MTSSSRTYDDITTLGKNRLAFALDSAPEDNTVPDPRSTDVVTVDNWKHQMMIPFKVEGTLTAFLWPFYKTHPSDIHECFPCYPEAMPPAFKRDVILDFRYMSPKIRVFRSMPTPGNKEYLAWLAKIQNKKQDQWKKIGIFDLIQLSRNAHKVNPCLLLASLHFWEASTNTFHLPLGMLTPTLFDVAAITGLSPLGDTFDPTLELRHAFDFDRPGFQNFMEDHFDKESDDVSDEEHIAFLTLWLSYYVFCPGSLQIAKSYVPLAIQLLEGRRVSMGKLLLASLYRALGRATMQLKLLHESNKALNIYGTVWLLQHWLNATFEHALGCPPAVEASPINKERPI